MAILLKVIMLTCCFATTDALAQNIVQEISWSDLQDQNSLLIGKLDAPPEGESQPSITILNTSQAPWKDRVVWSVDSPAITQAQFVLEGRLRYTNLKGEADIEMLTHLGGEAHATKALSKGGAFKYQENLPLWRDFVLPVIIGGNTTDRPTRLELSVSLPPGGSVSFSALRLVEYETEDLMFMEPGQWWGATRVRQTGVAFGLYFGAMGCLLTFYSITKKGRTLTLRLVQLTAVIGASFLATAIAAITTGQPYPVYFPCLIVGLVLTPFSLAVTRSLKQPHAPLSTSATE